MSATGEECPHQRRRFGRAENGRAKNTCRALALIGFRSMMDEMETGPQGVGAAGRRVRLVQTAAPVDQRVVVVVVVVVSVYTSASGRGSGRSRRAYGDDGMRPLAAPVVQQRRSAHRMPVLGS